MALAPWGGATVGSGANAGSVEALEQTEGDPMTRNSKKPESACPSEEGILGCVDGTLQKERGAVEAHIAGCECCLERVADVLRTARLLEGTRLESAPPELERRAWALGRARSKARGGTSPAPGVRPSSAIERLLAGLFSYRAAATVAVASLITIGVLTTGIPGRRSADLPPVWRDVASSSPSVSPAAFRPQAPAGDVVVSAVDDEALRFVWDSAPGIERAVITIVDAETGESVVREAVGDAGYTLAADRLPALSGHRLEWMIEGATGTGRPVRSVAIPFRILTSSEED